MVKYLLFLLSLIYLNSNAQEFSVGENLAMGGKGFAQTGIYSLTSNAAGITSFTKPAIALAYQQHFLKTDIQSQGLFLALPIHHVGTVGFVVHNYGIIGTSTFLKAGLSYARKFGSAFSTSISANYHQRTVDKYEGDHTLSVDLGVQYLLGNDVQLGLSAKNISKSKFDASIQEPLATEIGLGFKYNVSSHLTLVSDLNYIDDRNTMGYHGGFSYAFDPRFVLRAGVKTAPMEYFTGFGILVKKFRIDSSFSFHSHLGTSPQLALCYEF